MPKHMRTTEPIDEFLASRGLTRKITAKDGSCLFRAVAEQVFHTQALHSDVRQACIRFMEKNRERFEPFVEGPFDEHLNKLLNAKEWAGQVEISALSLMYKRDFIIYQDPGKPPSNVTQNGFPEQILLCFSNNNHYDSVFSKRYHNNMGICQSIVYEILYKQVFKVPKEADDAVEILRNSPGKKSSRAYEFHNIQDRGMGGMDHSQRSPRRHEDDERDRFGRLRLEKRRPPLPYKVAKALDPEIYRNVEYDCWNEGNKEQMHQDFLMASGLQFCPGDKVQVILDDTKKWYSAHIQEVKPDKGPITVFVEDLGEKHEVPVKNVKPHPGNPPRPWTVAGGRGYKSVPPYHAKYSNGMPNGSDYRNRAKPMGKWGRNQGLHQGMMVAQSFPPSSGDAMPEQQGLPYNMRGQQNGNAQRPKDPTPYRSSTPPPRFMNRGVEGHPDHMGRGRPQGYMMQGHRGGRNGRMYSQGAPPGGYYEGDLSSEELEERKVFEEAVYEMQDQAAFPALSQPTCAPQPVPSNHQAQFWSKLRKDGRRSISPQQRMDTPSPHLSDKRGSDPMEGMLSGQFQEMVLTSPDQGGVDASCLERHYSPISPMTDEGMMQSSSPSMPKSATPPSLSISPSLEPQGGSPPPIAPAGYVPSVPMGIPFYGFLIPMTDWNITGQVNLGAPVSRDPHGNDLPMTDISTLKFFYNLGTEYYRRLCMLQQLQQQQSYQVQATGPIPQHQQPPPQQQQPHAGGGGGYTQMITHPGHMGMAPPGVGKNPYEGGGGMTMMSGGGGAQEDEEQQEAPVGYGGSGPARNSYSPAYISEPLPSNTASMSPPNNTVYSLANQCSAGGDYIPMPYQSQAMPHQSQVPQGNQIGMGTSPQNPYMYPPQMSAPIPMGYPGTKVQQQPHMATYAPAPSNHVTYVQMASPSMPHQPHMQQGSNPATNQGVAPVSCGQFVVHSSSVVSNSSCSSQDSGILSSSPTQATYTASG